MGLSLFTLTVVKKSFSLRQQQQRRRLLRHDTSHHDTVTIERKNERRRKQNRTKSRHRNSILAGNSDFGESHDNPDPLLRLPSVLRDRNVFCLSRRRRHYRRCRRCLQSVPMKTSQPGRHVSCHFPDWRSRQLYHAV